MAKFSVNNDMGGTKQAMAAAYKTLVAITAATATLTRGKIGDVLFGTPGTPADNAMEWDISRQTAAGTSTAATPASLGPFDRASGMVAAVNFTAEGTITAGSSMLYIPTNQRASYRWSANPGYELEIPNTNLAGFAIRGRSATYTGTAGVQAYHEE
jgi:hypothetical protein